MKYLHVLNIFENHCDNAHIIKSFFWLSIHRNIKNTPPQIKNTNKTKPKIKKKTNIKSTTAFRLGNS